VVEPVRQLGELFQVDEDLLGREPARGPPSEASRQWYDLAAVPEKDQGGDAIGDAVLRRDVRIPDFGPVHTAEVGHTPEVDPDEMKVFLEKRGDRRILQDAVQNFAVDTPVRSEVDEHGFAVLLGCGHAGRDLAFGARRRAALRTGGAHGNCRHHDRQYARRLSLGRGHAGVRRLVGLHARA
jgi:hypothetical protein